MSNARPPDVRAVKVTVFTVGLRSLEPHGRSMSGLPIGEPSASSGSPASAECLGPPGPEG